MKHSTWNNEYKTEAVFIRNNLKLQGVPEDVMYYEVRSTNSKDNVLFAQEVFDFNQIKSLLFVCKSYGAGRQWRTLTKYVPSHVQCIPYSFDTNFDEEPIMTRANWMNRPKSRSLVFGEYVRIVCYGKGGYNTSRSTGCWIYKIYLPILLTSYEFATEGLK